MFNNLMYEQEQEGDFVEARTYFGSREIFEGFGCPPLLSSSSSVPLRAKRESTPPGTPPKRLRSQEL